MKNELIIVAFPTIAQGNYFIQEMFGLFVDLKKINNNTFSANGKIIKTVCNRSNYRGMTPNFCFISEDMPKEVYNDILNSFKGEHRKIKVVL